MIFVVHAWIIITHALVIRQFWLFSCKLPVSISIRIGPHSAGSVFDFGLCVVAKLQFDVKMQFDVKITDQFE